MLVTVITLSVLVLGSAGDNVNTLVGTVKSPHLRFALRETPSHHGQLRSWCKTAATNCSEADLVTKRVKVSEEVMIKNNWMTVVKRRRDMTGDRPASDWNPADQVIEEGRVLDSKDRIVTLSGPAVYEVLDTETRRKEFLVVERPSQSFELDAKTQRTVLIRSATNQEVLHTMVVNSETYCKRSSCYFCLDYVRLYSCSPDGSYAVSFFVVVLCCCLLLWCCPCLRTTLCWFCRRTKPTSIVVQVQQTVTGRRKKPKTDSEKPEFIVPEEKAKPWSHLLVIAMLFGSCGACDRNILTSASFEDCLRIDESTLRCAVKTEIAATLNLNEKLCVTLNDPALNASTDVSIEFSGLDVSVDLVQEYFTHNWEPDSESIFHCPGSSECPGLCDSLDPNAGGEAGFGDSLIFPGVSQCFRKGGTWLDGCANPVSVGCVFGRWFLASWTSEVAEVHSFQGWNLKPKVTLRANNQQFVSSGFRESTQTPFGEFYSEGQLVTSSSALPTNLANLVITKRGSSDYEYYLGVASPRNSPQKGKVGDVQCQSFAASVVPIKEMCRFDTSIATASLQDKYVSYTFHPAGYKELSGNSFIKVPAKIGKGYWYYKDRALQGKMQESDPLMVRLTVTGQIQVLVSKVLVCPEVRNVEMKGCCECDDNADLSFEIRSSCLSGAVLVHLQQGSSKTISVDHEWKMITLKVAMNSCEGRETMTIQSTSGIKSLDFDYQLILKPVTDSEFLIVDTAPVSSQISLVGKLGIAFGAAIGSALLLIGVVLMMYFFGPLILTLGANVLRRIRQAISERRIFQAKKMV